jgi:GNAT superfamily N-acetyltransferase
MELRPLQLADLPALRALAPLAEAEGYRFVGRFLAELPASTVVDDVIAGFVAVFDHDCLIAFGGVTRDPYHTRSDVARLRHVYVRRDRRGEGIGRHLVSALETRARAAGYQLLRLRTDTVAAAHFYEHLGYSIVDEDAATHQRSLARNDPASSIDER